MVFSLRWVFCTDVRTDSDFCFVHHWLFGFYNRRRMCLLCGTPDSSYIVGYVSSLKGYTWWYVKKPLGSKSLIFYYKLASLLTLCRRANYKVVIAIPCIAEETRLSTFLYTTSRTCVCQLVSVTYASRLLTAWSRMFGSQATNKQTGLDSLFLEP